MKTKTKTKGVTLKIVKSASKSKKWTAIFTDKGTRVTRKVHFGQKGYRDFTLVKDKKEALAARERYRQRHARDKLKDPFSPGALSMTILWGPSRQMKRNITTFKRLYGLT